MPRNTKGHQTGTPVSGGSICARQHHTRALSDNSQYGTICLPFVPTSVADGQVTYYQVLELESDEITLVETDFEAGKPLFYQTPGTGSITFSAESAAGVELVTTPATDSFMELHGRYNECGYTHRGLLPEERQLLSDSQWRQSKGEAFPCVCEGAE